MPLFMSDVQPQPHSPHTLEEALEIFRGNRKQETQRRFTEEEMLEQAWASGGNLGEASPIIPDYWRGRCDFGGSASESSQAWYDKAVKQVRASAGNMGEKSPVIPGCLRGPLNTGGLRSSLKFKPPMPRAENT